MHGLVVDLLLKDRLLRTLPFDRGPLRIGRDLDNELVVENLGVAGRHARLLLEGGRVFVEDLGSEAGIRVNEQRVRGRVELAPGDRVAIGKHWLRVRSELGADDREPAEPAAPAERVASAEAASRSEPAGAGGATLDGLGARGLDRDALHSPHPSEAPSLGSARDDFDFGPLDLGGEEGDGKEKEPPDGPSASAAESPLRYAGLIVQRAGRIERVVSCDQDEFTIGRARGCDLVLDEEEVSRRHVRIVRDASGHWLEDLGSVNGTRVGGEPVDRHRLRVGDRFEIEGFELTFVLDREPVAAVDERQILAPEPEPVPEATPEPVLARGDGDPNSVTVLSLGLASDAECDDATVESALEATSRDVEPAAALRFELRLDLDALPDALRRALRRAAHEGVALRAELRVTETPDRDARPDRSS